MKKPDYREDIDALRGVSVALVVLYHAFPGFLPGGFIGVDVFFVISGFLITSIMLLSVQEKSFSLIGFYSRRIRRIFPAMLFVLLVTLLIGWLILFPEEYQQLGSHVKSASMFVLNFALIDELGYFDVESTYKPIIHFWTLSIEEQYYLLWPVLLLAYLKVSNRPALFFTIIIVASFSVNLYFVGDNPEATFFHTASRLWQLAAGSLLATLTMKHSLPRRNWLFIVGCLTIFIAAIFIDGGDSYPGYLAVAPTAGAMLAILSNSRFPTYLGLSRLGLISYSLYLWHWVLISFSYIYLGGSPSNFGLVIVVFVAFVAAYLTFRYIEPLRYKRRVVTGLVLCAIAVGLFGFYVEQQNGLPERASIAYYQKAGYQFTRTPHVDGVCDNYVNKYLDEERLFYYCRGSNLDAGKLIAVVGDSHAHAWYPGIAKIAEKHGYGVILLANTSCPPLPGFEWGHNSKQRETCQASIRQIMVLLSSENRIKKVAFTTRGPVYIHGEVKGEFTNRSVAQSLEANRENKRLTHNSYFSGFQNMLEYLEGIHHIKDVYYLIENPELDFLPKEVVRRPFDYFGISVNRDYMSRSLYLKRMAKYRRGVKKLSFEKLELLDPMQVLCDSKKCYSLINGNFVYADDDHYSVYGSLLVSKYFENEIFGYSADESHENSGD